MTTPPRPSWRKPLGILAMLAGLAVYAVVVIALLDPIRGWPVLAQMAVYLLAGTVWILPLGRFLRWMETGRWR